jgi:hypothetical protein
MSANDPKRTSVDAQAECTPLYRGRSTGVWQTRIAHGDGRLAAIVTQIQIVIERKGNTATPASAFGTNV